MGIKTQFSGPVDAKTSEKIDGKQEQKWVKWAGQIAILATGAPAPFLTWSTYSQNAANDLYHDFV